MPEMLTDEEWNDKNFKRSRETGKIKIGNLIIGVHETVT